MRGRLRALTSSSGRFFGRSDGYALPLVLVAIAVFLLYAAESSARVTREVRVTRLKANSEMALYAADAGFNRARARLIKMAGNGDMMHLHNRTDTLVLSDGEPGGTYWLAVTPTGNADEYYVVSTGTYGVEPFAATRVVSGIIRKSGTVNSAGVPIRNRVATTYDP